MRVFRTSYRDRKGKLKRPKKWYAEFRDQNEIIRRVPGFTSRSATEELGRKLEQLVAYHQATGGQTDPALQRWLNDLPNSLREKLVDLRLVEGGRVAATMSLDQHLTDWGGALHAKGNTAAHVKLVVSRARRVIEECEFRHYGQINQSAVMSYLRSLRDGDDKISAQTFNFYLKATGQFCRWMVKERRAGENPLAHLQCLNVRTDRRHDRRVLSVEELHALLDATAKGPIRAKASGQDRAVLYWVAVETGLRAGELRSVRVVNFRLDGDAPEVTVAAAYSKNRRESRLPLRPETVALLKEYLKDKAPTDLAFAVPPKEHVAKMIKADLEDARIAWLKKAKDDVKELQKREQSDFLSYRDHHSRVADFHALRHTFITNLARGGVHPKVAQALARHSTFALTMDRYSHTSDGGEPVKALQVLPALPMLKVTPAPSGPRNRAPRKPKQKVKAADNDEGVLALCLAQLASLGVRSGDSVRRVETEVGNAQRAAGTQNNNGGGEIRTHETLAGLPVFKTGAFDHSATPPAVTEL